MADKRFRATVVRANGSEEDWGFFAVHVTEAGVAAFRANEATKNGEYDHILAPGTWREISDIFEESN